MNNGLILLIVSIVVPIVYILISNPKISRDLKKKVYIGVYDYKNTCYKRKF